MLLIMSAVPHPQRWFNRLTISDHGAHRERARFGFGPLIAVRAGLKVPYLFRNNPPS